MRKRIHQVLYWLSRRFQDRPVLSSLPVTQGLRGRSIDYAALEERVVYSATPLLDVPVEDLPDRADERDALPTERSVDGEANDSTIAYHASPDSPSAVVPIQDELVVGDWNDWSSESNGFCSEWFPANRLLAFDAFGSGNGPAIAAMPDSTIQTLGTPDGAGEDSKSLLSVSHELVVIDTEVEGYEELVDDLLRQDLAHRHVEVLLLDSSRDGMEQITAALQSFQDLDRLHLVSHGQAGEIRLGSSILNLDTIGGYAGDLANWATAFHHQGDLLIYGCGVAGNDAGIALLDAVSELTRTDVAASDDVTGHATVYGDWDLEWHQGLVDADVVFSIDTQTDWTYSLATVMVSTTNDLVNGNINSIAQLLTDDGGDGISLREAIMAANRTAGHDDIRFNTASTLQRTSNSGNEQGGDFDIYTDMSIHGLGMNQTIINASGMGRVFEIFGGAKVTIEGLSLLNGNDPGSGGGIWVRNSELTLDSVQLFNCVAANSGGGILANQSTLTISDSSIFGNRTTSGNGGGLNLDTSSSQITNSTIYNNRGQNGGGIAHTAGGAGTMTLTGVTISGNQADDDGGGLFAAAPASVNYSTIANNVAGKDGGGISGNDSQVMMGSSILSGNTAGGNPDNADVSLNSTGFNLDSSGTANLSGIGDISGTTGNPIDPKLGPLQISSGASVPTHGLLSGSAAIDSGRSLSTPILGANQVLSNLMPDIGAFQTTVDTAKLYWADSSAGTISRANADGSGMQILLSGLSAPHSVAVDSVNGFLYWSDLTTNRVYRSLLDGTSKIDLISIGLNDPRGIAIDLTSNSIFIADDGIFSNRILRANLTTGGGLTTIVNDSSFPTDIFVDTLQGKIYWSNRGDLLGPGFVKRANLDGTSIQTIITSAHALVDSPRGLVVDNVTNALYFLDIGASGEKLLKVNLANLSDVTVVTSTPTAPTALALDAENGQLYWADSSLDRIYRINTNGTNETALFSSRPFVAGLEYIAIPYGLQGIDDSAIASSGTPQLINVVANDFDPEGDVIRVLDVTAPSQGSVINHQNGTISYVGNPASIGTDSFQYLISDGQDGTVHYWGLGNDLQDAIGSFDGVAHGNVSSSVGTFGQGAVFDEVGDWIQIGDFGYSDSFTVTFDFKIAEVAGSDYQYLYSHGDSNATRSLNVFIGEDSLSGFAGIMKTSFGDSTDTYNPDALNFDARSLIDNQWHTYTLTVQTGVGAKVFVDGTLKASDATRGGGAFNPGTDLFLGGRHDLDANQFFGGALDSVRVMNRALSTAEVVTFGTGTHESTATVTVTLANHAPTVAALSNWTIQEGSSLVLTAVGADLDGDSLSYQWDLDLDGSYDDASGATTTVAWATLKGMGYDNGPPQTVGLRVFDSQGGEITATGLVNVVNVAPTVSLSGAATTIGGTPYTLNLTATDPGSDTITSWTIDWGDGSTQTITGNPSAVTHTYANDGYSRQILAVANDEDGSHWQGNLFVASNDTGKILRFNAGTGGFVSGFSVSAPVDVEVGPDGFVYVSSYGAPGSIRVYDPVTSTLVRTLTTGINGPTRMTFGPDGDLFVTNWGSDNVTRFDVQTNTPMGTFIPSGSGGLANPDGITFGPDGFVYVANGQNGDILRFNTNGVYIDRLVNTGASGSIDLSFGPDGLLYVSANSRHAIFRYNPLTPASTPQTLVSVSSSISLAGIRFTPDGYMLVATETSINSSIRRYLPASGTLVDEYITSPASPNQLDEPIGMAFLPLHQVSVLNLAPSDLGLSNQSVVEGLSGATIGNLTIVDGNPGDSHVISVSDSRFEVVRGVLRLKATEQLNASTGSSVALSLTATDQRGGTYTEAFIIQVNNVNDAPQLHQTIFSLPNVLQNQGNPTGMSVAQFLSAMGGDAITDADLGATEGIAVIGVDIQHGNWEYSTNSGVSWNSFAARGVSIGVPDPKHGLLLDVNARVRFVPLAGYTGSSGDLLFRAWDKTQGTTGSDNVDVQYQGVTSAFSQTTGRLSTTVVPIPAIAYAGTVAVSTQEDTPFVFTSSNGQPISVTDGSPADNMLRVVLQADRGQIQLGNLVGVQIISGANQSSMVGLTGTESALNAAFEGLRWTPPINYQGNASIQVTIEGDVGLDGRYTFNNSQLGNDSSPQGLHDGVVVGAISTIDPTRGNVLSLDGNDYLQVTGVSGHANMTIAGWVRLNAGAGFGQLAVIGDSVEITLDEASGGVTGSYFDGTATWKTASGVTLSGSGWHHVGYSVDSVNDTQTLYLDGIPVATTHFTPDIVYASSSSTVGAKAGGTIGVQGRIDDLVLFDRSLDHADMQRLAADSRGVSGRISLTVQAVNDEQQLLVNSPLHVLEGGSSIISTSFLSTVDIDHGANQIVYSVTLGPAHGQLLLAGVGPTTTFTQNDIQSGRLLYVHDGGETSTDTFRFTVDDGVGVATTGNFDFVVSGVNDSPIVFGPGSASIFGNGTFAFRTVDGTAIQFSDVDAQGGPLEISVLSSGGHLTLGSTAGLMFLQGDGVADGAMQFRGTEADLQTALDGMTFAPLARFGGTASVKLIVNDLGNRGAGGPRQATIDTSIHVTSLATAVADHYVAVSGIPLATPAISGVLANDLGTLGLSASLATPPNHGQIVLRPDGSFSYIPATGFVGTETFAYVVTDGIITDTGIVQINVLAAPPSKIPDLPADDIQEEVVDDQDQSPVPPVGGLASRPQEDDRERIDVRPKETSTGHQSEGTPTWNLDNGSVTTSGSTLRQEDGSANFRERRSEIARLDASVDLLHQTYELFTPGFDFVTQFGQFDSLSDDVFQVAATKQLVVERTALSLSAGLSIGWILWTLRGGYLAASLMTPWMMVDPLPILGYLDDGEEGRVDDKDAMERMMDNSKKKAKTRFPRNRARELAKRETE